MNIDTTSVPDASQAVPSGYSIIGPTRHPTRISGKLTHGLLMQHVITGSYSFLDGTEIVFVNQGWAAREAQRIATTKDKGSSKLTTPISDVRAQAAARHGVQQLWRWCSYTTSVRQRKKYSQNLAGSQLRG